MTLESFFTKLNQNLDVAKATLKQELSRKVNYLAEHLEKFSNAEIRGELESLVDEFLMQFTTVYQEVISYVEEEIPIVGELPIKKPKKKPKKKEKKPAQNDEYVKPTYVHRAFTDDGLRVSKDARPMIMEILNKKIKEDIETIKKQLPTFVKGEKEGEKKRITIKPEDVSEDRILRNHLAELGRKLDSIPLDLNGGNYELLILLKNIEN